MKTIKLTESDITRLVKKVLNEQEHENYMFFSNLEQMRRQCDILLNEFEPHMIDEILSGGHDWAADHISEAKNNMDQVFDFLMNEKEGGELQPHDEMGVVSETEMTEKQKKNTPTNPSLWSKSLSWAKSRYKVCPSAYCNGAAAKHYKSLGGKWKKK